MIELALEEDARARRILKLPGLDRVESGRCGLDFGAALIGRGRWDGFDPLRLVPG